MFLKSVSIIVFIHFLLDKPLFRLLRDSDDNFEDEYDSITHIYLCEKKCKYRLVYRKEVISQ